MSIIHNTIIHNTGLRVAHKKLFLILFMAGFAAGILFANAFAKSYSSGVGLLGEYFLLNFKYSDINYKELFGYVFVKRMKAFSLLWLLGMTAIGVIAMCAAILWIGFSAGILLTAAVIKYGFTGIIISLAGNFPQVIVYLSVVMLFADRIICLIYDKRINSSKNTALKYLIYFIIGAFFVVGGVILETFVNPFILKLALQLI